MYMECRHIKTSGLPCGSPALKGGQFCYFHSQSRISCADEDRKYKPIQLPSPDDAAAIRLSVARISEAAIYGRIELKKAALLLDALKIAARFIDPKAFFYEPKTVRSAEQTAEGDSLAPRNFSCNDDEDCNNCPYSDLCPRCIHPDNDDEEDEQDDDDVEDDDNDEEDEDQNEDETDDDQEEDGDNVQEVENQEAEDVDMGNARNDESKDEPNPSSQSALPSRHSAP